jgi:Tol biopolymer transport system component
MTMMRRTMTVLAALAMMGCRAAERRVGAERITLASASEGNLDIDFSKDGRLALSKIIAGKAAIFVANADASEPRRVSFGVFDNFPWWSPDGKWIAFRRDAGNQSDVLIVPSDGGPELMVAGTSADELLRGWLADGSGLLFVRAGARGFEPWVYRLADRSSARLFEVDGSVDVFPSPDGKSVGYTLLKDGKSTLWLWDRETKAHRQLTTEGFEVARPRCFSPDGSAILFESRRTGTADLWRVDVATGERRQLTLDVADDGNGRWSPDGSRIVFTSNRGGQPDLWVLSTGEADVQRVTDDAFEEVGPNWTPDGRGIVADAILGHQHLFALPTGGGPAVPLSSGDWDVGSVSAMNIGVRIAEVSRDGSRVTFSGTRNGDADVWVVPTAGGESRLVSGAPGYDGEPTWSQDGTRIAFTSVRSGSRDIWIAAVDGADSAAPRQLTDWPGSEFNAEWSPDGRTVAFLSNRESPGVDIWTMPAMGGAPKRLTRFGTVNETMKWSRDGQSIVFSAQVESAGGEVVFSVPSDGGPTRQIAPPTSSVVDWSPDGRELAITRCTAGYCVLEVRSAQGDLLRTLTTGEVVYEWTLRWSSSGAQVLGVSQDLTSLAFNRVDLRPATGGFGRILPGPPGSSVFAVGFGSGDSTAIVIAGPGSLTLQRIAAPAPIRAP